MSILISLVQGASFFLLWLLRLLCVFREFQPRRSAGMSCVETLLLLDEADGLLRVRVMNFSKSSLYRKILCFSKLTCESSPSPIIDFLAFRNGEEHFVFSVLLVRLDSRCVYLL